MWQVYMTDEFEKWLRKLRDTRAKYVISNYFEKVSYEGILIGDRKHLGSGIMEYRLHMGPGYRVYYAIEGDKIIILLIGGDKDSQSSDIKRARSILKEWRKSNGIQKI